MALTFVAAAAAVAGVGSILSDLFYRDQARVSRRLDDEFRKNQREKASRSLLLKDLGRTAVELAGEQPTLRQRLYTLVEQSGLDIQPQRILVIAAAIGLGVAAVVALLRPDGLSVSMAALAGASLPILYVQHKRKQRMDQLRAQLPDAFDLMARVVRAGQTISQAQMAVADEFSPPLAAEFSYCYEQQNLGLSPELALRDLARRTGLLEVRIFVTALLVQQQTGGNLSELLENLADVVRERFRIQRKIKSLTAEGRVQGLVLLMLPPVLYLVMYALNREFAGVLLEFPAVLVGIAVSELLGALWIRKIVNFDF
jgi:tight adherence protein B